MPDEIGDQVCGLGKRAADTEDSQRTDVRMFHLHGQKVNRWTPGLRIWGVLALGFIRTVGVE